ADKGRQRNPRMNTNGHEWKVAPPSLAATTEDHPRFPWRRPTSTARDGGATSHSCPFVSIRGISSVPIRVHPCPSVVSNVGSFFVPLPRGPAPRLRRPRLRGFLLAIGLWMMIPVTAAMAADVAVVVNPKVPVDNLSLAEVRKVLL